MELTNRKIHIRECLEFARGFFNGFLKAFPDAADFNDRP